MTARPAIPAGQGGEHSTCNLDYGKSLRKAGKWTGTSDTKVQSV